MKERDGAGVPVESRAGVEARVGGWEEAGGDEGEEGAVEVGVEGEGGEDLVGVEGEGAEGEGAG